MAKGSTRENKKQAAPATQDRISENGANAGHITDNRPVAAAHGHLQQMADNRPQVQQWQAYPLITGKTRLRPVEGQAELAGSNRKDAIEILKEHGGLPPGKFLPPMVGTYPNQGQIGVNFFSKKGTYPLPGPPIKGYYHKKIEKARQADSTIKPLEQISKINEDEGEVASEHEVEFLGVKLKVSGKNTELSVQSFGNLNIIYFSGQIPILSLPIFTGSVANINAQAHISADATFGAPTVSSEDGEKTIGLDSGLNISAGGQISLEAGPGIPYVSLTAGLYTGIDAEAKVGVASKIIINSNKTTFVIDKVLAGEVNLSATVGAQASATFLFFNHTLYKVQFAKFELAKRDVAINIGTIEDIKTELKEKLFTGSFFREAIEEKMIALADENDLTDLPQTTRESLITYIYKNIYIYNRLPTFLSNFYEKNRNKGGA